MLLTVLWCIVYSKTYGRQERYIQSFGGETWGKDHSEDLGIGGRIMCFWPTAKLLSRWLWMELPQAILISNPPLLIGLYSTFNLEPRGECWGRLGCVWWGKVVGSLYTRLVRLCEGRGVGACTMRRTVRLQREEKTEMSLDWPLNTHVVRVPGGEAVSA
jgi:hypothetical protein